MSIQTGLPLGKFLQNLVAEVIEADAEMQLLQRNAWRELNSGYPLAEGLDRLENLGVKEVSLTFRIEPTRSGFLSRLKAASRHLLGKPQPVATRHITLVEKLAGVDVSGFEVTVTVSRDKNSAFRSDTRSQNGSMQDVSVSHIFS